MTIEKMRKKLSLKQKALKAKALKLMDAEVRARKLEDELHSLRTVHANIEVNSNRWLGSKAIYKALLEAELEKFDFYGD